MHIGLLNLSDPLWTGGETFTRLLARVTSGSKNVQVSLLSDGEKKSIEGIREVKLNRIQSPQSLVDKLRRKFGTRVPLDPIATAISEEKIDVVLPVFDVGNRLPCAVIGWIPDFQHHHEAGFFSPDDIRWRNQVAQRIGERCNRILFSSRDALTTYSSLFPDFACKAKAIPFPSTMAFENLEGAECRSSRSNYHIPEKFVFVPNQFWRHKNHEAVIDAIEIAKTRGVTLHCVFTGLPHDSRDPQNGYLSGIMQRICRRGLAGQISLLGFVSRREMLDLFRTSTVVVQPSFSEGWSTSVQDALALGRPLICSDIPVHREQAPGAVGFFDPKQPIQLADLLVKQWPLLRPGPNRESEVAAIESESARIREYGHQVVQLCREASADFRSGSRTAIRRR